MLINYPEWRGEAALWCGFVDTVLGRVGVEPSLQRESFPPEVLFWYNWSSVPIQISEHSMCEHRLVKLSYTSSSG